MDLDVAARGAPGTHRRRGPQFPGAHGKAKILGGQRAHRTDVDGVERIGIVQALPRRRGQKLAIPAKSHDQVLLARHLVAHADTARAQNAALLVEHDVPADVDDLGLAHLAALVARQHARPNRSSAAASMHSPALSQMGQSMGWLSRVNSSICRRTSSTLAELVMTSILSATAV